MADGFTIVCGSDERAKWLQHRRSGIGSSDAPAVLGLSPFKSALSVYAEKIGNFDDEEATEAMKWGRALEPRIIKAFADETTRDVVRGGSLLRSNRWPWMLCTLDASEYSFAEHEFDGAGVLEVKWSNWRVGDWTEGVPKHVWVQFQHQCAVTGYKWGSVAALLGSRFVHTDIERDDAFIDGVLVPALREFWTRVEGRIPVSPDGSESSAAALRALYPEDNGLTVTLPGEFIELDMLRETLLLERKVRDARIAEIDQRFKAAIGTATVGVLSNGAQYTYRLQKRSGYEVAPTQFRALRRRAKGQADA